MFRWRPAVSELHFNMKKRLIIKNEPSTSEEKIGVSGGCEKSEENDPHDPLMDFKTTRRSVIRGALGAGFGLATFGCFDLSKSDPLDGGEDGGTDASSDT